MTVLAFRGSLTTGDFGNIENWFLDYVIERSTSRMKQAWTVDAGIEQPIRLVRYDSGAEGVAEYLDVESDGSISLEAETIGNKLVENVVVLELGCPHVAGGVSNEQSRQRKREKRSNSVA